MKVQSSSACSSMIAKSRNIRWLTRFAAGEARSSHRAMVWRAWPVTRAVADMLTPSTRRLATWSHSLRAQRRPLYAVPVCVLTASAKYTLRALARRWMALTEEMAIHDQHLARLTTETSPTLREGFGLHPCGYASRRPPAPAHQSDAPVNGTVLRVPLALGPLPFEFLVTWCPTSTRRSWVPSKAHINTGRLCSAGSSCHAVPRRPRSYAALRLPHSRRPRLRSSLAGGLPRNHQGEMRASQVAGPSSSSVP